MRQNRIRQVFFFALYKSEFNQTFRACFTVRDSQHSVALISSGCYCNNNQQFSANNTLRRTLQSGRCRLPSCSILVPANLNSGEDSAFVPHTPVLLLLLSSPPPNNLIGLATLFCLGVGDCKLEINTLR
jgi:hypothetical protein